MSVRLAVVVDLWESKEFDLDECRLLPRAVGHQNHPPPPESKQRQQPFHNHLGVVVSIIDQLLILIVESQSPCLLTLFAVTSPDNQSNHSYLPLCTLPLSASKRYVSDPRRI